MTEESGVEWLYWRLWLQKRVDPNHVRKNWTIYDVLDAHDALDIEADIEALAAREARKK